LKVKDFLEKYRLGKAQKTVSKESDFEKEGKQNETLLMKEANSKVIPAEKLDNSVSGKAERKKKRLKKYITDTENQIDEWETKKQTAENPNERVRAEQEIKKLEVILEDYEDKLEDIM
jgi:hypothetical protein